MTDKNVNLDTASEDSSSPGMDISQRPTADSRNLITGNEGIAEDSSGKPLSFSDLDSVLLPGKASRDEGGKQGGKKKPTKEDQDEEFSEEDLEEDLDGADEDGDLEDMEEDADSEDDSEEDEDEEQDEDDPDAEEDEEDSEGAASDAYDKEIVKVKVNGKWRKYTGKQMKEFVASGAHLKEQRDEFHAEVQRFTQDFETGKAKLVEADNILRPIIHAAQKGDIEEAVIETFKLRGINKVQAKWTLIDKMIPVVARLLDISPEFVKTRVAEKREFIRQEQIKDENDFLREEAARNQANPDKEADAESEKEIYNFMEEHDVTKKQLRTAVSWLKEHTYKGKEDEISLPVISRYFQSKRAIDKAHTAIASVRPKLAGDAEFFDRVVNLAKRKPDWEIDKIARWVEKKARTIKKTEGDSQINELRKDVSRKVLKANNKSALNKATPSSQRKPKTFSDLAGDAELLDV